MFHRSLALVGLTALLLQGCAQPAAPGAAVDADDLRLGVAKTCSFTPVQPTPGQTVQATITMTNDGWCAFRASEVKGTAYLLGLVVDRPEHGELLIRKWAGETRVEYNPQGGYVGTDKFLVALRPNNGAADSRVEITATISRGEGVPVATPAAAPSTETPTTTRRRTPARRSSSSSSSRS